MHVPTDRPLASWIRELIATGKLYQFYKTDEWKALRAEVMADHHNECERCEAQGRLRRADTVHHEHEVRREPELALTRWEVDAAGVKREVLHPLCNQCHNDVHGRTLKGNKPKPPITTERWD